MKNKTIITIGIIVILSIAVLLKNYGCGNSTPKLKAWSKSDEIEITGNDIALKLFKKDNQWRINEQEYPGDKDLIESIEKKVRDLKLLDLVSEKGYYDKYGLTDETGVVVIVKESGKLLRKLVIGKSGSTNNHSFVRIDDKNEIYLASITKSDFIRSVPDLRDKKIFDVKSPDVKSFSISYAGKNFIFQPNPNKDNIDKTGDNIDDSADKNAEAKNDSPKWICKGYENILLNDSSIDSMLAVFSPLKANEFPEKMLKENLKNKLCTVIIESYDRKIELLIYDQKDQGMNLASSSESEYVFTLGNWQVNKLFIKDLNELSVKK
ncbi:MAG: DUF4340 domain-containing protein [Leptospirales bacterium]|nr:DUF4340 domain-containing protein [Leptospirales bacterium]